MARPQGGTIQKLTMTLTYDGPPVHSRCMCSIWEGWRYKNLIIINFHFIFYSLNWVKAEGHKYRKPCVLLADMDDDDYPIFVQFEEIFSISSNIYFKLIPQTTVQYSTHYHAYIITPTSPITYKMIFLIPLHFTQELLMVSHLMVKKQLY